MHFIPTLLCIIRYYNKIETLNKFLYLMGNNLCHSEILSGTHPLSLNLVIHKNTSRLQYKENKL